MGWKRVLLTVGIALLVSVGLVFAQVNWVKYTYFNNVGGLNDDLSVTEIADNEATELQNVVFDTGGAIKKRYGYVTIPSGTANTVTSGTGFSLTGLHLYRQSDGDRYLIAVGNEGGKALIYQKTYEVGGGLNMTGVWSNITSSGTVPATGYSDDYLASFATAEDSAIIAFKTTTGTRPLKYTGSGLIVPAITDTDCPDASIVVYHKNHLFTNDIDNPSRIWFSALDDITDYTATDFIDISTNDGTQVRGMVSAFDNLYIFKDRSIWRLAGYERDSWVLSKMVEGIGTLSHQSIAVVNNTIFFITDQNDIAAYDGGYNVKFLSQKIRNTIGGMNYARATNALGLPYSSYRLGDRDYYAALSYAGSSENNRVLLFDTARNAWTKFIGFKPNAWCVGDDSVGKQIMIFGDYDGYVHYYPSTSYQDGNVTNSTINAYYKTKWFKYPEVSLGDKYLRKIKTYTLSQTTNSSCLNAEVYADYESQGKIISLPLEQSTAKWDTAIWDESTWAGQTLLINTTEIEKGKNMFQFNYSNNQTDTGFTLFGWETFIEPSDRI